MKKLISSFIFWIIFGSVFASSSLQDGDIVFQSERGSFAKAIQLATHSPYNHVGMVFLKNGKSYVYEAVGPVKFTPLEEWIKRTQGHYTAKRLKKAGQILTPVILAKMKSLTEKYKGKKYSWTFLWSDEELYCSGLVWKMYQKSTGLEMGRFQKLKDLDLSSPIVKKELKKKFGSYIPVNLKLISPAQIFESDFLTTVISQ